MHLHVFLPFWIISSFLHYFVGLTKTGTGGKPCDLKRLREEHMGEEGTPKDIMSVASSDSRLYPTIVSVGLQCHMDPSLQWN